MEIEQLDAYGDMQFMAKGHAEPSAFKRAVLEQYDCHSSEPRHIYMRKRPDASGDYNWVAEECKPGRGAFKATFAEFESMAETNTGDSCKALVDSLDI